MKTDVTEYIKSNLSIIDVMQRYGFDVDKKGHCLCPFHNEKTPSFKIYENNKGFYCFGCGSGGDVIKFVQKLFNIPFQEALRKIDLDFSFNLFGNVDYRDREKSAKQAFLLKKQRKEKEEEKKKAYLQYWAVFDEWKRLSENKKKYAPKTHEEEPHPLFIEALQKLTHQEYLLDCADIERRKYDN